MDQAQWEKQKRSGSSKAEVAYYDTYRDYLYAYAQYRLALDSGMLSTPGNKRTTAGGGGVNRNELR
jgi:hypothetical protein